MADKESTTKTFSIFHRKKKKKEQEKGHREPIVVKMFKDNKPGPDATVSHSSSEGDKETEPTEEKKKVKFTPDSKYFTIMIYGIMFVVFAGIVVSCIMKISTIVDFLLGVMRVLSPFIAAALIAFIMNPIVNGIEGGLFISLLKVKKPKVRFALSIIIAYVIVFGLLIFGIIKLGPQLGQSISELASKSSSMYKSFIDFVGSLGDKLPQFDLSGIEEKINALVPTLVQKLTESSTEILPRIFSSAVAIIKGFVNGLLAIAISIYMICDKRRIARSSTKIIYAILPEKKARPFIDTSKECFQIFGGFIIGKALDSLIIGIICFIIVSILKLPYTVLISVIVGVTNMIPFFGPFIGAIPGIIIYLCIDPIYALVFAVVILAIQQFDGWILGPMILGDSTGIRPIWVIFGITFFGAYFGFLGMFLGVPITAVVLFLIEKALNKKLNKKNIEIT